jgi:hypothetical protein
MRIWDLPPKILCRNHLLGEHNELHAVWTVITGQRKGYSHHPEVMRWRGRLRALYFMHDRIVAEMTRRGWNHRSPLDRRKARGSARQAVLVDSLRGQRQILRAKGCKCRV